jgi:Holliday junction resolvasome RuvABC endonuclease subunit
MVMILSLDCATKTGWCLWERGTTMPFESGVQDFSKIRGESNGIMFLKFRKWLKDLLILWKIKVVVYEQAHHRGGAATEICVNLTGRVQEVCAELGIEYATVHTMTLKKHATGSGKADKSAMIQVATKILNRPPIDDNEADAVLLGRYAAENY